MLANRGEGKDKGWKERGEVPVMMFVDVTAGGVTVETVTTVEATPKQEHAELNLAVPLHAAA